MNEDRVGTIARTLRNAIIEQAIKPGTHLPEDTIGDRFGASRTIVRAALEEIVVSRLAGALQPDQIAALEAHVAEEEKVRNVDEPHSIRLAGEFHVLLAEFTGSQVLTQYMRELTSRCCLMLAMYSRPHSSECGVTEHQELVGLLKKGDQATAVKAMRSHLQGVIDRALIQPPKREDRPLDEILNSYASD